MPLKKLVLDNGFRLYLDPKPSETIALAIGFLIGSALEPSNKRGLTHLTEHMLFRSNERFSFRDIDRAFELSGGDANAYTSRDTIVLIFEVLRDAFRNVLEVVKWMLLGRKINEKEFKLEKEVVLQEIAEAESNPRERIYDLAFLALYGRSDLGDPIHGYRETVEAIEPQDILWLKECFFVGKLGVAVLSGGFSKEDIEEVIKLLEGFEESPCQKLKTPSRCEPRNLVEKSSETKHAYIALSMEVEAPEEVVSVAKFLLGEGATSILFERLRSEKGLVYSYGVIHDMTPWCNTLVIVLEGVEVDRVEEAKEDLLEAIEALSKLSAEYIQGRKRYFLFTTRPETITPYTRALTSYYLILRGKPLSFEERREMLVRMDWRSLKLRSVAKVFVEIMPED